MLGLVCLPVSCPLPSDRLKCSRLLTHPSHRLHPICCLQTPSGSACMVRVGQEQGAATHVCIWHPPLTTCYMIWQSWCDVVPPHPLPRMQAP